jgi:hypothetical protein
MPFGKETFMFSIFLAESCKIYHYQTEPCKVQYSWAEPLWFRIFREKTSYSLALSGRAM